MSLIFNTISLVGRESVARAGVKGSGSFRQLGPELKVGEWQFLALNAKPDFLLALMKILTT